jgi:hypothetical protein
LILPLLPTTPFALLAAWCFAQSSERLHDWLVGHDVFGPLIRNWRENGAIAPRAKVVATAMIVAAIALSVALGLPGWVLAVQAAVLSAVLVFIHSRPSGPKVSA